MGQEEVRRGGRPGNSGVSALSGRSRAANTPSHNLTLLHDASLRQSAEIGDVGGWRWMCLPGDLVKAKWVGRQHHQHTQQHPWIPYGPETPSRAARASAAFRQDRET